MSKPTSILWKLFLDETGQTPLSSADWLQKWFYGSAPVPAQLHLLAEATPQLGTFRRVLRNLALGRILEDGACRGDTGDTLRCDTTVREELLLAYIFLLCLQISRQPPLDRAHVLFLQDDAVFLEIGDGDPRAGGIGPPEWKKATLEIAQTIHSWLTSNYSIHRTSTRWPTIPELGLGILVSRTGTAQGQNMQFKNLRRFEGKYVERLLPTLSALRSFGMGAQPCKLQRLRDRHLEVVEHDQEFRNLLGETGRLKDERRQVFLSAYAMVVEYFAWLSARDTKPPPGHPGIASELTIADIGSEMDALISGKELPASVRTSARLPDWASEAVQRVALHQVKSAQNKKRSFPKMAVPLFETTVRQGALPISVKVKVEGNRDKRTMSIRIPEHELPDSIQWYEFELATADTADNGGLILQSIPVEPTDPTIAESGADAWATYQWSVPSAILARLCESSEVTVTSGSAFVTTADGLGANILIAIGIAGKSASLVS